MLLTVDNILWYFPPGLPKVIDLRFPRNCIYCSIATRNWYYFWTRILIAMVTVYFKLEPNKSTNSAQTRKWSWGKRVNLNSRNYTEKLSIKQIIGSAFYSNIDKLVYFISARYASCRQEYVSRHMLTSIYMITFQVFAETILLLHSSMCLTVCGRLNRSGFSRRGYSLEAWLWNTLSTIR